ncbi:MAG: metallophosphoesterase [Candidatus Hodarchaeota archaeon]
MKIQPVINSPALIIETKRERILCVADLHLGYEFKLAILGIKIPNQTPRILERLENLIEQTNPSHLIVLGDLKHQIITIFPQKFRINSFLKKIANLTRISIIPGNHDGDISKALPEGTILHPPQGTLIEERKAVALIHGHAWPFPELFKADYLIMGHNHPSIQFKDSLGFRSIEPAWIRAKLDIQKLVGGYLKYVGVRTKDPLKSFEEKFDLVPKQPNLIIMPTFNHLLGGLPLNLKKPKLLGPLLQADSDSVREGGAFLLDGSYLGRIKDLEKLAEPESRP